jgi:hypothetical protein
MLPLGLLVVLAVIWAVESGALSVPDRWNPWASLHIRDRPNSLTRFKLRKLTEDSALCQTVLADTNVTYVRIPDTTMGPGCAFRNAVTISATSAELSEPFSLSCPAAVSLAMWEAQVLQPAAESHFGLPVRKLEHFGSYACRNLYHRTAGNRSRHATADALDVAGFVFADGKRVRVLTDWGGAGPEARFLREVKDGACPFFDAVLGPEYNRAHRDHFHFDRGRYQVCR